MSTSDFDHVFKVVTRDLPRTGIDYLLIGGHAVNYYGFTRATQDIDFMITSDASSSVQELMKQAGFTNISVHDAVVFFSRPGSSIRVDFLEVDPGTMEKLLTHAVEVEYLYGYTLRVPRLQDLIAMKLFALRSGSSKRWDKDFPDIVHLLVEHDWDLERELKPLCEEFGTDSLYQKLSERIEELRHA